MPEFTVKEVRLPELHLPEIKRDDIVRSLSGIRLPEVDLAVAGRRRAVPGWARAALPWRKTGLSSDDLGKLAAAALAAARFARPAAPRSRWRMMGRRADPISRTRLVALVRPTPRRSGRRLAVLAIVAGTIAWLVMRNPANRLRLDRAARTARLRFEEMRSGRPEVIELESGMPLTVATSESEATVVGEVVAPGAVTMTAPEAVEPA